MLAHTRGKQGKTVNRDWFLGDPDVGFIKDFKTAIIIMFEELKGNMITEWEENIVLISTWKISSEGNYVKRTKDLQIQLRHVTMLTTRKRISHKLTHSEPQAYMENKTIRLLE